jgi:hypothetical protein
MCLMSSSIEIWGFEVTFSKLFSYSDCKAFSEKIVSMIVLSFPEIPLFYFEMGKALMGGISKMKTIAFSGYLRKLYSLSLVAVLKSFISFS